MGARTLFAVVGLTGVALLASCAGLAGPAGPGSGDPSESPVSGTPTEEPTVVEPTPLLVEPRPGLVQVRARPWDRVEVVDPRALLVYFTSGVEACYGVARVDVRYGPEAVTVTLFEGRAPGDRVCIELAVEKVVRVGLEEPLGDREVVDGARSKEA
ncbi:MAG TPA: hypothetical protein VNO34_02410 [Actinomycetota bacterium]|nr:hypothetical protein [Actinomycetota bacterium]